MTTQPTPQQNTAAYISGFEDGKRVNAAELRRLYALNQELRAHLTQCSEALAHCMGNEYAPVVEARAAIRARGQA